MGFPHQYSQYEKPSLNAIFLQYPVKSTSKEAISTGSPPHTAVSHVTTNLPSFPYILFLASFPLLSHVGADIDWSMVSLCVSGSLSYLVLLVTSWGVSPATVTSPPVTDVILFSVIRGDFITQHSNTARLQELSNCLQFVMRVR